MTEPVRDEDVTAAVPPGTPRRPRSVTLRAGLATLLGACVHVYLQVRMLLGIPGFSLHHFKWFYQTDQLSYFGIAVNVYHGRSGSTEPLTETGVSNYPRLWYLLMGLLARITHVDPVVMWWLMGLTLQFVLAGLLGWALFTTTRVWWVAVLSPLPFLIGTFAGVLNHAYLYRTERGGRVMWGPFAQIYPLNGGAAGISLAACAILGLVIAGWNGFRPRITIAAGVFAALCAGFVGNTQTYSFIGLCYVLLYAVSVYGLQALRPRARAGFAGVSLLLLTLVLLLGPTLAQHMGPLPVFVLGLVPALPGYLALVRHISWVLPAVTVLAAALALPTVVSTLRGLAEGDPFLLYRQASTADVKGLYSIPVDAFALRGAVALLLVAILTLTPHARSRLTRSFALGAFVSWALLATNDRWGPAQEPNRFWIDEFMLILVVGFPLLAGVAVESLRRVRRRPRSVAGVVTVVAIVLWGAAATTSAQDWVLFNDVARAKGVSWWPSPRSQAIKSVLAGLPRRGIVLTDRCLDPLSLKAISGARVAAYNYGLAWPDHRLELTAVIRARERRRVDAHLAQQAGVDYLLTDSHCRRMPVSRGELGLVSTRTYVDPRGEQAEVRLWDITPYPAQRG